MTWNHRVIEFTDEDGDKWYSIQEVYYDENDKPMGYCDPFVGSDSLGGLNTLIERFKEASEQPVLKAKDFKGEVK